MTDKTVDGLLKAMLMFSRTINHSLETHAVATVAAKPLSNSKVQVLRLLSQQGKQTSTQVARFLGVTKPAVSQIIDSMVHSRLVTRRQALVDRREVELELTKTGKAQFVAIRRTQRRLLRRMLRGVRTRAVVERTDLLSDLVVSLVQADTAFEDYCLQCGAHDDDRCVLIGGDANCLFLQHAGETDKGRNRSPDKS